MPRNKSNARWRRLVGSACAMVALLSFAGCTDDTVIPAASSFSLPPIQPPKVEAGEMVFDLRLQSGSVAFLPGTRTPTLGINGDLLGPTLVVKRGDKVRMRVQNDIGEETTLHWHGLHIPARMDGGPHQRIAPGALWEPTFTIDNRAGLYWYHPHLEGATGRHVYSGLAGLIIIQDEEEAKLDLPRTYGVDDFPIIIQDRRFKADGSFSYLTDIADHQGMRGPNVLVNGRRLPPLNVPAQVVRLRVLNGSNSRPYLLGLPDQRALYVIASDGGLLRQPAKTTRLEVWPGERYEMLVDFSGLKGREISLQSYSSELGLTDGAADELDASDYALLRFRVGETTKGAGGKPGAAIPTSLSTIAPIAANTAARERSFLIQMQVGGVMTINGNTMKMDRIDEVVTLGDTEIWSFRNMSDAAHPIHVHDVQFQVLSRSAGMGGGMFGGGGGAVTGGVRPWETGWKDTVVVPPRSSVRVISTFEDFADPSRPYMYHCHILEHEDRGMMGQFIVRESK